VTSDAVEGTVDQASNPNVREAVGGTPSRREAAVDVSLVVVESGVRVAHVVGEIDLAVADDLQEQLSHSVTEEGNDLVVDLTDVTFLDSRGLAALVATGKRVRELDGAMRLVVTNPTQLRVLALTRIDQAFPVHPTLQDALEAAG
jgi:anti-sigma B factor antagonist